ncbi:DUF4190 domain-containing protein [Glycomyces albidus]|jgi:hypothetical protein|uniref:DUF4190 domain-containing protein n=1 Tax=Glycomyces albidus TaxID=2656774 RepID=A0A6L5G4K2_9ACTN|nr:DUF4190 domain-containing protein [Glycomyces albidus]MQM24561.1 DUF4190 domain-containing protein [Glycomyces albidus]
MSTPDPANPEQQPPPPQYYGQPPYAPYGAYPPPYGYPYPPPKPVNGMAITAMILGIVGACNPIGVLGLIFGLIAKRQMAERNEGGDGFATAGIVLGWIGVASIVFWIGYVLFFATVFGTAFEQLEDLPTDDPTWDYSVLTPAGVA